MSEIPIVTSCFLCPALAACRHNIVNGEGKPGASILIVGQAPNETDDSYNRPFVGRHGKLLQLLLQGAGIPLSMTYRTNAVRCLSPGNRRPTDTEIAACRPYLIEEIRALKPAVIVALGEPALTSLYSMDGSAMLEYAELQKQYEADLKACNIETEAWMFRRTVAAGKQPKHDDGTKWLKPKRPRRPIKPKTSKKALKDIAGHTLIQPDTGIPMVASYHPSYLMRGHYNESTLVIDHLKKAKRIAEGTQTYGSLGDYMTIKTVEQLEALADYLLSDAVDTIYFDTETTGLKWKSDELLCISIAGTRDEGYVVPILHNPGTGVPELFWSLDDVDRVIELLKRIFGSKKPKCGHNVLFDMRMLERDANNPWITAATAFGIRINGKIRDTELMHHSLAESLPHNMTAVLTNTDMPFYEDDIGKYSMGKKRMAKVPNDILWKYSAADADGLPRIEEVLYPRMEAEGVDWVMENITYPMLRVCRNMEDRGVPINVEYFERLCRFYQDEEERLEETLWHVNPELGKFRWWVSNDLRDVLFKQLGLPPSGRMTKASKGCEDCKNEECELHDQTGADALKDIYEATKHPLLPIIMGLKKLRKMRDTYLDGGKGGWARHIRNERIHGTYKISRAETGRLASADPNMQNPPKGIHIHPAGGTCKDPKCKAFYINNYGIDTTNAFRDIIEAPRGKGIMNVDWNQLEVWVLSYELAERFGDSTLLDILLSGRDVHTVMGRMLFPDIDPEMSEAQWRVVHKDLRDKAKTFVFGLAYGLTVFGIVQRTGMSEDEAKYLLNRFFQLVPGLKKYFAYVRKSMLEHGYVTNRFLRRRHGEPSLIKAMGDDIALEASFREDINMPIQGGGSDLHSAASAITDSWKALQDRGCYAIMSVHDSLLFEFDWPNDEYALQTAWMIKNLWEETAKNMLTPEGKRLGWQCIVEADWGPTFGTPTWHLSADGAVKGPE